jgi:uridine kinase
MHEKIMQMIKAKLEKTDYLIVGISGGSCSGKTRIAEEVQQLLSEIKVEAKILHLDDYYRSIGPITEEKFEYNFDEPAALEMELLAEHLSELKSGMAIKKPVYDFKSHNRLSYESVVPAKIMLLDGLFALHETLREYLDLKIFVHCPEEIRLQRRILRDTRERGRTRKSVLHQFQTVKKMHDTHVEPLKSYADVIVNCY